jgi:hypothetical protein
MKRTIATILLITSSAWAVAPAHAMRCHPSGCMCVWCQFV